MDFPFRVRPRRAAGVRRHAADAADRSTTRASSSFPCRSIAPRPTSAARATDRTRSCRPRRTWSCGTRRCASTSTASASSRCRRWSCRSARWRRCVDEIERVAYEIVGRDKFLVSLGGEHSITPPLVSAAARKYTGLSRAADRRARRHARRLHGHAAQPRLRHAARRSSTRASPRSASAASRPRKRRSCRG